MRKTTSRFVSFIKRHRLLSIAIAVVIILGGWWAIVSYMPHPLGDKLEYLGKRDFGGVIFGDANPASIYYYATDIEPSDMKNIFAAQYSPLKNVAYKNAHFITKEGEFTFTYEITSPFKTSKKYIVSIVHSQYSLAKKYLRNTP